MPIPPFDHARRGIACLATSVTILAAGLLGGCGAASNDNSGSVAGSSSCTGTAQGCPVSSTSSGSSSSGSGAGSGSTSSGTPGTCSTTGTGRTDDFKQPVTLQAPTTDGLREGDIVVGSGAQPQTGQLLTVQYTGWLADGTQFDSSRKVGSQPFQFTLGQGQVIKGWDEGLSTMKVGGVRRLVIPAALGYGAAGSPPVIPANATLTFDIELLCAG